MHFHLNIIVLSPLTWNIITSKDIFWGLCYHNHVRKPSIYSQQRSSFKRSKRRGQAWANSSAWGEGLLFMFPVGEITSPVGAGVWSLAERQSDWWETCSKGVCSHCFKLFITSPPSLSSHFIPVDTTELCFPMDALIKPSTLGGHSKETLDGRQCCFSTRLSKVAGKSWQTPWQLIAWKRSQCTYVQSQVWLWVEFDPVYKQRQRND